MKNVTGAEGPERIIAGVLSSNLFGVLGVEAGPGRTGSSSSATGSG
jgi:hypothetical protein